MASFIINTCIKTEKLQLALDDEKSSNFFSKFSNTFLFLFSNKMLVFSAGIHKMLVRKTNGENNYQTASEETV